MEFKIRCSQIGKIITMPKSKAAKEAGELSSGAKTYCETWLKEQLYSRRKEFSSKYTQKGNEVEDNNIDFVAEFYDYGMLAKNEEYYTNEFLTGTPDVITKDTVIDIKSSWDCFTFPLFDTDIPNSDYYWQLQGYMALTGLNKASLIYVLSDTPMHLIEKEAYFYCKNNGYDELDMDILKEFVNKMTYSKIYNKLRVKRFDIEKDEKAIKLIENRVLACRNYIGLKNNIK
jgi:hypothetical protein